MLKLLLLVSLVVSLAFGEETAASVAEDFFSKTSSTHTNNWAIDTSRFWFNYRHPANALSFYWAVKKLGIPDSQIILFLADDMACNPRNVFPGAVYNSESHAFNLYEGNVEVDYRGYEVQVENALRVLTGRHDPSLPQSKRLLSDERSNVLVYMSGHGGDEFLKFQDSEEITSDDLAAAFHQMAEKRRYNELLFVIDTCQANTLYTKFYSKNVLAIGSARYGENAYSHGSDPAIGLSLMDRFSYYSTEYFSRHLQPESNTSLLDYFSSFDSVKLHSHADWREDLMERPLNEVLLTDFFGQFVHVQPIPPQHSLSSSPDFQAKFRTAVEAELKSQASQPLPTLVKTQSPKLELTNFSFRFDYQFFAGLVAFALSPLLLRKFF